MASGHSRLFLLLLSCTALLLTSHCTEAQTYTIVHGRPTIDSNTVTLTCRLDGGGTFPSTETAQFWLNDSTTGLPYESEQGQPTWRFEIRRDLEGEYFCGPSAHEISNKVEVIYRPVYNRTLNFIDERVVRVEVGETAIIPPYIGPGRWHSRYYIDWFNVNHTLVGRVDGRRNPINGLLPERYSVNIGDFSLGIQSVARSDAGRYTGELGVREGTMDHPYTPTRSIKLLVYEPPVINESPEDVVMRHQIGANVTFSCTAKGFPRPVITWTHNSEPATVSRYTQTDTNLSDGVVESVLTVMDVTAQDSGQVRCIATVTPGGEVSPLETTTEADLSVLIINKAVAKRTVDGGLTFIVFIAKELPVDVHIHLAFKGQQHVVSPYSFHSGTKLPFFLDEPPFPVNHFTVDVTVLHGNTHSAPFMIESNVLLNECDLRLVIIVVSAAVALLVVCVLCLTVCYYFKTRPGYRNRTTTQNFKKAKCGVEKYHLYQCAFKPECATKEDKLAFLGYAAHVVLGKNHPCLNSTSGQVQTGRQISEAGKDHPSELTAVTIEESDRPHTNNNHSEGQISSNKHEEREKCCSGCIRKLLCKCCKLPRQSSEKYEELDRSDAIQKAKKLLNESGCKMPRENN